MLRRSSLSIRFLILRLRGQNGSGRSVVARRKDERERAERSHRLPERVRVGYNARRTVRIARCEWRRVSARRCGGTVYATVSKTVALHGLVGSNPTTGTTAFIRLRASPRLFLILTELPLRQHISRPMPQTSLIACAYHYHSSAAYAWGKYSPTTLYAGCG